MHVRSSLNAHGARETGKACHGIIAQAKKKCAK
jgi:hypothetical protein